MPTVMRTAGLRLFFYSNEGTEPPHVHVEHQGHTAKFWLQPVELATNRGFPPHRIRAIRRAVMANRAYILEVWDEFFGA